MSFLNRLIVLTGVTTLLLALLGALVLLDFESSSNRESLAVSDVQPQSLTGEDVLITGRGFDAHTRAALFFDTGNRRAIIGKLKSTAEISGLTSRGNLVYMASAHSGLQVLDLSRPQTPRILGTEKKIFEAAWDLELAGHHVVVSDVKKGLVIVDVSFPERPRAVGHLPEKNRKSWGLALLSENIALLAQGLDGLAVIDIADRRHPREISRIESRGFSWEVEVSGQLAYLCDGGGGLRIFDLSTPTDPRPLGEYDTYGHLRDLTLVDDIAYLADGRKGLTVLDVADPKQPRLLAADEELDNLWRMGSYGGKVYAGGTGRGLMELNVDDPARPRITGQVAVPGSVRGLTIVNDHLVFADGIYGIQVVPLETLRPVQAAFTIPARGKAYVLTRKDELMAVAEKDEGVRFFSTRNSGNVQLLETEGVAPVLRDMDAHQDIFWFAGGPQGLLSFRQQRADLLKSVGRLVVPREIDRVALYHEGRRALLAAGGGGVLVADTSDPVKPVIKNRLLGQGLVMDLLLEEDHAWVIQREGKLVRIDLSDPDQPRVTATLNLPGPLQAMRKVGETLCIARYDKGAHLVEAGSSESLYLQGSVLPQRKVNLLWSSADHLLVQVPAADYPLRAEELVLFRKSKGQGVREIARVPAPGFFSDAAEAGAFLYLAERDGYLWRMEKSRLPQLVLVEIDDSPQIHSFLKNFGDRLWGNSSFGLKSMDISEPLAPHPQAVALDNFQNIVDMNWHGDHLLILDASSGLHAYRTNAEGGPTPAGFLALESSIKDWDQDGGLGYALSKNGRLKVIDIADPTCLRLLGTLDVGGNHQSFAVHNGFALVNSGTDGIQVWDISDPERAQIVGEIAMAWPESEFLYSREVHWKDDLAVVAVGDGGILTLDMSDPHEPKVAGRFNSTNFIVDVWVYGRHAYVGTAHQGVLVLDLANPAQPVLMGTLETRGHVRDLMFAPPYVWLALDSGGVMAVPMPVEATQVEVESGERLRAGFPDPPLPGSYILSVFSSSATQVVEEGIDYFPDR